MLYVAGRNVNVFILKSSNATNDFLINRNWLSELPVSVAEIESENDFPSVACNGCVVDALFGTGVNRPLEGLAKSLVHFINEIDVYTLSVDMPSGLFADEPTPGDAIIKADVTLSFQSPKLALFMAENACYTGHWMTLDIGLHSAFKPTNNIRWVLKGDGLLSINKYNKHDYKGSLGHAIISAGSNGKMGAAVLSAKACLRSGNGLLTMAVPLDSFSIIHNALPEAMCMRQDELIEVKKQKINAIGLGPGWGMDELQMSLLGRIIRTAECPILIDASALFHLSKNLGFLNLRPSAFATVITPHIGEFDRLFGKSDNSFDRLKLAIQKAKEFKVFMVLKGAFTQVVTPDGLVYINSTGNPGMAKGGSGDALSGIITSLLAQGYTPLHACVLGVYAHGLAGDIAAEKMGEQGMLPTDLINCLSDAWKILHEND
jgi:hydroxyethylthiazole kinase-like uncharacterized protein yjeF